MLVLSRKQGESIELAEVGVVVRVIGLKKSKVQLGIEAPQEITIHRGERLDGSEGNSPRFDGACPDMGDGIRDELVRVEAEVAAMAELAAPRDRMIARQVAADLIERLAGIERAVRIATRHQQEERRLSEFIKLPPDLLEQSPPARRAEAECEQIVSEVSSNNDRTGCVRQRESGYVIGGYDLQTCNVA